MRSQAGLEVSGLEFGAGVPELGETLLEEVVEERLADQVVHGVVGG